MMEIFKYGLGYSCTSNLRAYSREIRTLARPHQQCHGRSFLKTESREPWIELLRSFFPRDGKAAIWDGRPPCEFLHTDAQKSDNISIIFFTQAAIRGVAQFLLKTRQFKCGQLVAATVFGNFCQSGQSFPQTC